jgi:uncharacterized protein YdeI (YjbR/CyaY-like superfamily)
VGSRDKRVDAYIAKSRDFAKPILSELREIVHEACPDAQETIKWGAPFYEYQGVMCMMAAFKQHCSLGFWKERFVYDDTAKGKKLSERLGRIESADDLPPRKDIISLVKKAAKVNEQGVKSPTRSADRPKKPEIPVPADFGAALRKNRKAQERFDAFPPSHRREYLAWITEAKTEATREKRMKTALEWIADGKSRNWKYQR